MTHLQENIMSLRALQRPFAIAEGCIFMRIIWTLHDVAAACHVILAVTRTVQFVGIIAAVVLFVAFERRVNALAVRAVERTCGVIPSHRIIIPFQVKYEERRPLRDRLHRSQFHNANGLTGRTGVGTTHERKKRLARGQFPRLPVVC